MTQLRYLTRKHLMKSSHGFYALFAGASLSLAALPAMPVAAQSASNDAAPICMTRTPSEGAAVNIILPASNAGAMRAKGFETVPCSQSFATAAQRETYRDAICLAASKRSHSLQEAYELRLGERPAVLCGMAELAVSRWKRGGSQ